MDFEGKRSGQIPAFGDWDNANELPITQYFESARQAGLVRYTSTNLTPHQSCDPYISSNGRGRGGGYGFACNDVYAADFQKPPLRVLAVPHHHRKSKEYCNNNRRRCGCGCPPHLKEQQRIKQQVKVYDVLDVKYHQQRTKSQQQQLLHHHQKQQQQLPKHCAVTDKDHHHHHHPTILTTCRATHRPLTSSVAATATTTNVKPVDEDLYKIPPELLHYNSKRKRMLGFFSKCLVPPCNA